MEWLEEKLKLVIIVRRREKTKFVQIDFENLMCMSLKPKILPKRYPFKNIKNIIKIQRPKNVC